MPDPTLRLKVTGALSKVIRLPPDWIAKLPDPSFDPVIADLTMDSLDVLELCMEVETRTGAEIDPADLLAVNTIDDLVQLVAGKTKGGAASPQPARREGPAPLSMLQESTWSTCQKLQDPSAYVLRMISEIDGPLDVERLHSCLTDIVARHGILRTTFPLVDGKPVQQVAPVGKVDLPLVDLSDNLHPELAAQDLIAAESLTTDLAVGPLCRLLLVRLRPGKHLLLRLFHHLTWDGWSSKIFLDELALLYEAKRPGGKQLALAQTMQFGDYAAWQRETYDPQGPEYRNIVAWWAERLQDVPPQPSLPFSRMERVTAFDPGVDYMPRPIDGAVMDRLEVLRKDTGSSLYKIWLAALVALLGAGMNYSDVVIGGYVTRRRRPELRKVIGDFANTVPLRLACRADAPFRDFLSDLGNSVQADEAQAEIPYGRLGHELAALGVAMPSIEFIFAASLDHHIGELSFSDLTVKRYRLPKPQGPAWGSTIDLVKRGDEYSTVTRFDALRYDPLLVAGFVDRLHAFVDLASRQPKMSVGELVDATSAALSDA